MMDFVITRDKFDELIKEYGNLINNHLYDYAEEAIQKGGEFRIIQEYTNASTDVLVRIKTITELNEFFERLERNSWQL